MDKKKLYRILFDNKVVILFVVLCVGATIASKQPLTFVAPELFTRIARNSVLVLSLIIPVIAGMGLNFGIVIGAMAAQIALFWTTYWGIHGILGFLATVCMATPIAVLFGFLAGKLFNKMKGSEMIGGLVLSYFAEGLYLLLFLFIFGGVIPLDNPTLMIATGVGVKNTIDLSSTIKYALDTIPMLNIIEVGFYLLVLGNIGTLILKKSKGLSVNMAAVVLRLAAGAVIYGLTFVPAIEQLLAQDRLLLLRAVEICCAGTVVWQLWRFVNDKYIYKREFQVKRAAAAIVTAAVVYALTYIPAIFNVLIVVQLPVMTYICIAGLGMFNNLLMKTRLGQNMRTVGQSRVVANAAGINVDRTRIIAMIFSTVLASWGQLIFLQNVGTFSTYGAHTQVGQFAIAALLVGGASVQKANNRQAITGIILFHTLFIVAPLAGRELFGDAVIGEYFRVFVSYGVIAMALAMHAWKKVVKKDNKKPESGPKAAAA